MRERDRFGVKRQPPVDFLIPAIPLVAYDRVADAGEVHAYLMFPAGQQIDFQQRIVFGFFEHFVSRVSELALARVMGRVHSVRLVLRQVGRDGRGALLTMAMNDGEIFFLRVLPLVLQAKLCRFVLGEDKNPRSLPIEPVHDENTISRFGHALPNIIGKNEVSGAGFLSSRADGQQSRRFIDHDNVLVFVQDRESSREKSAMSSGVLGHRQCRNLRC